MNNHIKFKHKSTSLSSKEQGQAGQPLKQSSITAYRSPIMSAMNKQKYQQCTQKLAAMCARDLRPLSIVEGKGFKQFCHELNPQYIVPSRTTVSNYVTFQYNEEVTKVKDLLKSQTAVSLTSDHWTSLATEGYIIMTAHFVDKDWNFQNAVLATKKVTDGHTGENTAHEIRSIASDFGLSDEQVAGIVTDNASNMVYCVEHLNWPHIRCFAHTLQLSIRKGFDTVDSISRMIAACKKLVNHFRKSVIATNELHIRQNQMNIPEHNLIIDCPTRWNSTFDMFERLQEQRMAVCAVLHDKNATKVSGARALDLHDNQWLIMEGMVNVLRPFYMATRVMCSEEYQTVGGVYPILHSLVQNHLCENEADPVAIASFKNFIKSDLQTRFKMGTDDTCRSIAMLNTFLDPRYRSLPFLTDEQRGIVRGAIVYRVDGCAAEDNSSATKSEESQSTTYEPSSKRGHLSQDDMSYLLGCFYESDCEIVTPSTVDEEIRMYLSEKPVPTSMNPFKWWSVNHNTYPKLAVLARKLLCVPATSVSSERVFSTAGGTVTKLRASLDSDTVNKLIFLNKRVKQHEMLDKRDNDITEASRAVQIKQEPSSPIKTAASEPPLSTDPPLPTLPTLPDPE